MESKPRTLSQNSALHLMFTQLADQLVEEGLDMKKVLKPEIEIKWTGEMVKTYLFKPLMRIQTGKDSTTELTTKEIDFVFETLNKHLGEKFGIVLTFPSTDSLINKSLLNK